jgi:hypothetical protein
VPSTVALDAGFGSSEVEGTGRGDIVFLGVGDGHGPPQKIVRVKLRLRRREFRAPAVSICDGGIRHVHEQA